MFVRRSSLLAFGLSLLLTSVTASALDPDPATHQQILGQFNAQLGAVFQPLDVAGDGGIVLQDGTGQLTLVQTTWPAGTLGLDWTPGASSISTADLNGDGRDDLIVQPVALAGQASVIITATGNQLPSSISQVIPSNTTPLNFDWSSTTHQVVAGDFDGDHRKELLMQATNPGDVSHIVHADINGQITVETQPIHDGDFGRRWSAQDVTLYVGDFNGDGRQDILMQVNPGAPSASESDYALLLADAGGTFSSVTETWNNADMGEDWDANHHHIIVEDVNGDGIMDIVVQGNDNDPTNPSSFVMLGNGQGRFVQASAHWTGTKTKAQIASLIPTGTTNTADTSDPGVVASQTVPDLGSASVQNPSGPASGSGTIRAANAVGALQGSGGVSGGAATYSIPIAVPPGIAGMQPSVSLSYSSRGGNGEVGMGWSLNAGSQIHRCPATQAMDGYSSGVTYTSSDRLCMDGQHLILLTGTYGADNAVYRTELDGMSRITEIGAISSGTSHFTVDTKDGHELRYGWGTNIGSSPNAVFTPVGAPAPLAWGLGMEVDQYNNSIIYYYTAFGPGENLLTSIVYTGLGATAGDREVDFTYGTRDDMSNQYLAGGLTSQTQILSYIRTSAGGNHIRTYSLEYQASGSSKRSLLNEVQECAGSNGTLACLAPTNLDWQQSGNSFKDPQNIDPAEFGSLSGVPVTNISDQANLTTPGDTDGDGRKELLFSRVSVDANGIVNYRGAKVYFMNANGSVRDSVDISTRFTDFLSITGADLDDTGAVALVGPVAAGDGSGITHVGYIKYNGTQSNASFTSTTDTGIIYSYPTGTQNHYQSIVGLLDMDGDGLADIVAITDDPNNSANHMLAYYPNITCSGNCNHAVQFATTPVKILSEPDYHGGGGTLPIQAKVLGDLDGNGRPDFAVKFTDAGGTESETVFTMVGTGGGALTFPMYNIATYDSQLMDINGDGLPDFGASCPNGGNDFCYSLNTGKAANIKGPAIDSGSTNSVPNGAIPGDFDNDGRTEYIYPFTLLADYCVDYQNVMVSGNPETIYKVCANTESTWSPYAPPPDDYGIYAWHKVKFVPVSDGSGGVKYQPVTSDPHIIAQNGLTVAMDLQGDGLTDVVSPFSKWYQYGSFMNMGLGYTPVVGMSIDSNVNSSSTGLNGAQDMMTAATDGFGVKSRWTYYPLSTSQQFNSVPVYYAPAIGDSQRYAGSNDYFYFASSMFVVGTYKVNDGIGGTVEHDFHYAQAIYNNQGRGFQGFRIVADDALVNGDHPTGSRTVQVYHQKFPLSGMLKESWDQPLDDAFDITNPQVGSDVIDHVINAWGCLQSGAVSQMTVDGVSCQNTQVAHTFIPVLKQSTATKNDFTTGMLLSKIVTQYCAPGSACASASDGYDIYANSLGSITTVTDAEGVYVTKVTNSYAPAVNTSTDWWVNQLTSKVVVNDAAYGTATLAGGLSRETDYTYGANRGLSTVITLPGTVYAKKVTYGYTNSSGQTRGNVTSVKVEGMPSTSPSIAARTTTTDYSSSNAYFPNVVTDPLGHVVNTGFDPATGQPLSVTDPNGVVTNYTYDVFGRRATSQVTAPVSLPVQTISYLNYVSGNDPNCADGTAYEVLTTQAGAAGHVTCYDQFNRVIRTKSDGFDSHVPVYQDTQYDDHGRVTKVSEPYIAGDTVYWNQTQYILTDMLGRVDWKLDAKGVKTQYNYNPAYETVNKGTDGTYVRIKTDVETMASGYDRHDRELHNSLGKMLTVTNAFGQTDPVSGKPFETDFTYDVDGNPVTITGADGSAITAVYDILGHKTDVTDPDQGYTHYTYDVLGELLTQTDAKNQTQTMTYDTLGHMLTKQSPEGTTTWCYDGLSYSISTHACIGSAVVGAKTKLTSVGQSWDNYQENFFFDNLGRPSRAEDIMDATPTLAGTVYDTDTTYNALGQVDTVVYPQTVFNAQPQITSITNSHSERPNTAVTLTAATAPDTDGPQALRYQWTQTAGPAVTLSGTTSLSSGFTTGVTPGTTYSFRFTADDSLSAGSANVTVMVPALPTVSNVANDGDSNNDGTYNVTWTAPAVSGDTPTYTLQEATSTSTTAPADAAYVNIFTNIAQSAGSQSVSHPGNGSYYYWYRLYGTGLSGQGPNSASAMIHVVVKPGAPASISPATASVSYNVSYTVSWGAFTGALPASKVFYEFYEAQVSNFTGQTLLYSGTNRSFTQAKPSSQTGDWYYRVRACNQNDGVKICSAYASPSHITVGSGPGGGGGGCPPPPQQCQLVLNDDFATLSNSSADQELTISDSQSADQDLSTDSFAALSAEVPAIPETPEPVSFQHRDPRAPRFAPPVYQAWDDAHLETASGTTQQGRFAVQYLYTATGYLQSLVDGVRPGVVYWTAGNLNARGQVVTETYGNGMTGSHTYDPASGFETDTQATVGSGGGAVPTLQSLHMDWDQLGNLLSRQASVMQPSGPTYNPAETFSYDVLNRLTKSQVANDAGTQTAVTYAYNSIGNMTCKSDVVGYDCGAGPAVNTGGYVYGQGGTHPHAVSRINDTNGTQLNTYSYDADGNMQNRSVTNPDATVTNTSMTWSSDNLPVTIYQDANNNSAFSYGPDKHRYKQVAKTGGNTETTEYSGALEYVTRSSTDLEYRHTITAYGKSVMLMTLTNDPSTGQPMMTPYYTLSDHLGSVDTVVDASGVIQPRESFDAFGGRRDSTHWMGKPTSTDVANARKVTNHGYTHHEELDNLGLVHANGRVLDPSIGRFLSVDPLYQAPTNSQSVNPYSYVMNNPLSLVDPSGYAATEAGGPLPLIPDVDYSADRSLSIDFGFGGGTGADDARDSNGNSLTVDMDILKTFVAQTYGSGASIYAMGTGSDSDGDAWMVIKGGNGKDITEGAAVPPASTHLGGSGDTGKISGAAPLVNKNGNSLSLTAAGVAVSRAVAETIPLGARGDPEAYRNISASGVAGDLHVCQSNNSCVVEGLADAVISVHRHVYQADGGPIADQGRNIWPGSKDQNMAALSGVVNVYRGADGITLGAIGLRNGEPFLTMLSSSNHPTSWMARQWNNLMLKWKPNPADPQNSIGVSDDQVAALAKEFADDPTRP